MTMLPNPKYKGDGPASRNADSAESGLYVDAKGRKKKPLMPMCAPRRCQRTITDWRKIAHSPQSAGFGISASDQQYVNGTRSL